MKTDVLIKLALAMLLLLCLAPMPYGYYQLVRFAGCIGFGILAFQAYSRENSFDAMTVLWTASALLINPFIKVALGRTVWNIVDVIWAALLILSLFKEKPTPRKGN